MPNSATILPFSGTYKNVLISEHFPISIPQEDIIVDTNSLKNSKIALDNDMIRMLATMDDTSLVLFLIIVGAIDIKNPPKDRSVFIEKKTIIDCLDLSTKNNRVNELLKKYLKRMSQQAHLDFTIERSDGNKDMGGIPGIKYFWSTDKSGVKFIFDEDFLMHLTNLKGNFTQFDFEVILKFKGEFTNSVYMLLKSQYDKYSSSHQMKKAEQQVFSMDSLRIITGTQERYQRFDNFKKHVLKEIQEEINNFSDLKISFETKTTMRKVTSIVFHVCRNPKYQKKHGKKPMQTPEKEKIDFLEVAFQGATSVFTTELQRVGVLTNEQKTNMQLMYDFQIKLYPLYKKMYDMPNKENNYFYSHADYLSKKMDDIENAEDLTAYLRGAANNYLLRISGGKKN